MSRFSPALFSDRTAENKKSTFQTGCGRRQKTGVEEVFCPCSAYFSGGLAARRMRVHGFASPGLPLSEIRCELCCLPILFAIKTRSGQYSWANRKIKKAGPELSGPAKVLSIFEVFIRAERRSRRVRHGGSGSDPLRFHWRRPVGFRPCLWLSVCWHPGRNR